MWTRDISEKIIYRGGAFMPENEAIVSVRDSDVFAGTERQWIHPAQRGARVEEHAFASRAPRYDGIGILAQCLAPLGRRRRGAFCPTVAAIETWRVVMLRVLNLVC